MDNSQSYNDVDVLFSVDLSTSSSTMQRVKTAVLDALMSFLPIGTEQKLSCISSQPQLVSPSIMLSSISNIFPSSVYSDRLGAFNSKSTINSSGESLAQIHTDNANYSNQNIVPPENTELVPELGLKIGVFLKDQTEKNLEAKQICVNTNELDKTSLLSRTQFTNSTRPTNLSIRQPINGLTDTNDYFLTEKHLSSGINSLFLESCTRSLPNKSKIKSMRNRQFCSVSLHSSRDLISISKSELYPQRLAVSSSGSLDCINSLDSCLLLIKSSSLDCICLSTSEFLEDTKLTRSCSLSCLHKSLLTADTHLLSFRSKRICSVDHNKKEFSRHHSNCFQQLQVEKDKIGLLSKKLSTQLSFQPDILVDRDSTSLCKIREAYAESIKRVANCVTITHKTDDVCPSTLSDAFLLFSPYKEKTKSNYMSVPAINSQDIILTEPEWQNQSLLLSVVEPKTYKTVESSQQTLSPNGCQEMQSLYAWRIMSALGSPNSASLSSSSSPVNETASSPIDYPIFHYPLNSYSGHLSSPNYPFVCSLPAYSQSLTCVNSPMYSQCLSIPSNQASFSASNHNNNLSGTFVNNIFGTGFGMGVNNASSAGFGIGLRESYVYKQFRMYSHSSDCWSLLALGCPHPRAKVVELKFVDRMRRQFEFTVDSFQILLDSLLNFYETCKFNKTTAHDHADIDKEILRKNYYPTVVAESVSGSFIEAFNHLQHHLIATKQPEMIRGGGLLKYCKLLVDGYRLADGVDVTTLERYMCSRFFIDFHDLQSQQAKIEAYLINHFRENDEELHMEYLNTIYRVVSGSTVCLMTHEHHQTLGLICSLLRRLECRLNARENAINLDAFAERHQLVLDQVFYGTAYFPCLTYLHPTFTPAGNAEPNLAKSAESEGESVISKDYLQLVLEKETVDASGTFSFQSKNCTNSNNSMQSTSLDASFQEPDLSQSNLQISHS